MIPEAHVTENAVSRLASFFKIDQGTESGRALLRLATDGVPKSMSEFEPPAKPVVEREDPPERVDPPDQASAAAARLRLAAPPSPPAAHPPAPRPETPPSTQSWEA